MYLLDKPRYINEKYKHNHTKGWHQQILVIWLRFRVFHFLISFSLCFAFDLVSLLGVYWQIFHCVYFYIFWILNEWNWTFLCQTQLAFASWWPRSRHLSMIHRLMLTVPRAMFSNFCKSFLWRSNNFSFPFQLWKLL